MIQAALLVEIHQHTNTSTSMTDSRLPAATGCPWTSYRLLPPAAPVHSTENGRQTHSAVWRHNNWSATCKQNSITITHVHRVRMNIINIALVKKLATN